MPRVTVRTAGEIAWADYVLPQTRDQLTPGLYRPRYDVAGLLTDRAAIDRPENYLNPPGTVTFNLDSSWSGKDIVGKVVHGQVKRRPGNWDTRFINCIPKSSPGRLPNDTGVFDLHDGASGRTWIIDSLIEPQFPNFYSNGVAGHSFRAIRVRSRYVNDHYGIFTAPSAGTRPTDAWVLGCIMEETVYWHGHRYVNAGSSILGASGNYDGVNPVIRPDPGGIFANYPIKSDGTHNDGIEVQGGYGAMSAPGANGVRTGNGIWVRGNVITPWDADQRALHPDGPAYKVPILGTQDNGRRAPQKPGQPAYVDGWRMRDGRFAPNGQAFIVVQNVNVIPEGCLVVEDNWFDDYGIGTNVQAKGPSSNPWDLHWTFLRNHFGGNMHEYSPGTNPSTYPIRIYGATNWGGTGRVNTYFEGGKAGFDTNVWDDPTEKFGKVGTPLKEGRNSGVVYTPVSTAG